MNGVIIQFFHWYHPGNLWNEFVEKAEYLRDLGFTAVWLPPANKCSLSIEGRAMMCMTFMILGNLIRREVLLRAMEQKRNI